MSGREIVQEDDGQEEPVTDESRALARTGGQAVQREAVGGLLRPSASPAELMESQTELEEIIKTNLEEGRDYGTVPGTNKPSLWKPGAERINAAFGVMPRYRIVEKEADHDREVEWTKERWKEAEKPDDDTIDAMKSAGTGRWRKFSGDWVWQERSDEEGTSRGFYRYVIECELVHRGSGAIVAHGIGSCSTMESKYIDRPRDLENTVLKMAQKRAYIAATLNAYGLSDRFTQDIEDNPEAFGGSSASSSSDSSGGSSGDPGRYGQKINDPEAFLDHPLGGGKHEDKTWRELCNSEDRSYVRWAIGDTGDEGMSILDEKHRGWLRDEADAAKAREEGGGEQPDLGQDGEPSATPDQRFELEAYMKHPKVQEQQAVMDKIERKLRQGDSLTEASAEAMLAQLREAVGPARGYGGEEEEAPGPFEEDDDLPF